MSITRRVTFRLYPSVSQNELLHYWRKLHKYLYKVGGIYIEVPTKKLAPSQTCPGCGIKCKKNLSQRYHICDCGIQQPLDRDVAAVMVMLNYVSHCGLGGFRRGASGEPVRARGKELAPSDAESSSSTLCGSMKQLGAKKRQKLVPLKD